MQNNNNEQTDSSPTHKPSCRSCCCGVILVLIIIHTIGYFVFTKIAENTIFLETENISLVKTYDLNEWKQDSFLQEDPRTNCFQENDNRTVIIMPTEEIILKENDEFFILVDYIWLRGFNISPKEKFYSRTCFRFYRIIKDKNENGTFDIKTVLLGSVSTNLYGAWRKVGMNRNISISPDGKYVVMSAHSVNSRSLGEFRNKEVLLIWEIGDNVVEKDITDSKGNKIPIIALARKNEPRY